MSTPTFALLATSVVILATADARAQTTTQRDEALPLDLNHALRLALSGSPEVDLADISRRAALARAGAARATFAPRPFIEGGLGWATIPTATGYISASGAFREDTMEVRTGLTGQLPIGTAYSVSVSASSDESSADGEALRPSYSTEGRVSVTQPMLRGAWGVLRNPGRIAQRDANAAGASLAALASDLGLAVIAAYWDLAVAQEGRRVADESLGLAQEQLRATKLRIASGRLSALDEIAANATVAARQDQIVAAEQVRLQSESALLALLAGAVGPRTGGDALPRAVRVTETPEPPSGQQQAPALGPETETALLRRADLRVLRERVAAARLQAESAEHDSLPDLSITATAGLRGLSGDRTAEGATAGVPAYFDGGLGQSAANAGRFPFFVISARLELPVPNTAANRSAEAAALDARARAAELQRGEWTVRNQMRQAVLGLTQAQERLQTASAALALAADSLEAERRKFEAGVSTIFEVSGVQQALAIAQNARFGALARYQVAKATLAHRRGTLLSELGLSVDASR